MEKINYKAVYFKFQNIKLKTIELLNLIKIWLSVRQFSSGLIFQIELAVHEDCCVVEQLGCHELRELANTPLPMLSGMSCFLLGIMGLLVELRFVHQVLDNTRDQLKLYYHKFERYLVKIYTAFNYFKQMVSNS